jgi:glycosyltransferase involved in cell wall biosynthesis
MKHLLFSIIIPAFNASETLANCLESIISQTCRDFEIIIIDGGSTDATMGIVETYAAKNAFIHLVSEKDNGIYDAMNKGITMARGEWLYFMGVDDELNNKDVLSEIAAGITDDIDIIYGNSIWVPENVMEAGEWGYYQLLNMSINHQRVFYRGGLFKKLGSFNLAYPVASDYEMNIRFFCEPGINKRYIDHKIANYHSGGFSSSKVDEVFWDNWETIFLKNFSPYLPKSDIYKRVSWYCWYSLQQGKYLKAGRIFFNIYTHTFSFSFLKHSLSQTFKVLKKSLNNN